MFPKRSLTIVPRKRMCPGGQSMNSFATAPFLGASLAALFLVVAGLVFIFQQVIAERRYVRLRAEYEARRAAYFAAESSVALEFGDDFRVVDEGIARR